MQTQIEVIQEKQKYLELEDIAPTWKARLDRGLTEEDWYELENCPEMCIVGEAHGWSRKYGDEGPDDCDGCCFYSGAIPALNRDIADRDRHIEHFVKHWNSKHVSSNRNQPSRHT